MSSERRRRKKRFQRLQKSVLKKLRVVCWDAISNGTIGKFEGVRMCGVDQLVYADTTDGVSGPCVIVFE